MAASAVEPLGGGVDVGGVEVERRQAGGAGPRCSGAQVVGSVGDGEAVEAADGAVVDDVDAGAVPGGEGAGALAEQAGQVLGGEEFDVLAGSEGGGELAGADGEVGADADRGGPGGAVRTGDGEDDHVDDGFAGAGGCGERGAEDGAVSSLAAVVAGEDAALAEVGEDEVLGGRAGGDGAAVGGCLEGAVQADAGEGVGAGPVEQADGLQHARPVGVEGVGVGHGELASAHEAAAGRGLVAELRGVEGQAHRQVAVGAEVGPDGGDGHLLGGRREAHVGAADAGGDERALVGVDLPAAGLLPQGPALEGGQGDAVEAVVLEGVAGDPVELVAHAQAEREQGVHAGGVGAADESEVFEQLPGGGGGVGGAGAGRGEQPGGVDRGRGGGAHAAAPIASRVTAVSRWALWAMS